jgi:transcriptional regulator with PAS, ATPase and Fis domain
MKQNILVVAANNSTKDAMYHYLYNIFSEYVNLDSSLISELNNEKEKKYDLIVFPNEPTVRTPKKYIKSDKIIFCHRTFNYKMIDGIFDLQPNSDVYFVNDNEYVVEEAMGQLRDMGVIYFNLIPYYPGCEVDTSITNAITPGEAQYAPKHIKRIIDLGSRVPSISDVSEIAQKLNLPIKIINFVTAEYLKSFANIVRNSNIQLKKLFKTQQILKNVFNNIDEGVCLINHDGIVKMANNKFGDILCLADMNIIDRNLSDILKDNGVKFQIDEILKDSKIIKNANRKDVLINSYELHGLSENSYLIYADYTETISNKEFIVRKKSDYKGVLKKYSFEDYITSDSATQNMIEKAKRISHNSACVLIQGESGTGKEIIAQSIHYDSSRRKYPFIPVNFAAIQPSLLDSELFGYVEGSFTGANKGGSKGLIEMAHKGTVFFDEIGDAPLSFQVRLLRVLQEKEIRRIGSSERIPIDVRFIAATNKNLFDMVAKGRFREDLFYRINVMPIDTIPLRDRKSDISTMFNNFIKEYFNDYDIKLGDVCTDEVIEYLMGYSFRGNVRELINLVEYFSCIKGAKKIGLSELPKYMTRVDSEPVKSLTEYEYNILGVINQSPKIGRYKIYEALKLNNSDITESKIRTILKKLQNDKYIVINNTRGGCEITYLGKMILRSINNK